MAIVRKRVASCRRMRQRPGHWLDLRQEFEADGTRGFTPAPAMTDVVTADPDEARDSGPRDFQPACQSGATRSGGKARCRTPSQRMASAPGDGVSSSGASVPEPDAPRLPPSRQPLRRSRPAPDLGFFAPSRHGRWVVAPEGSDASRCSADRRRHSPRQTGERVRGRSLDGTRGMLLAPTNKPSSSRSRAATACAGGTGTRLATWLPGTGSARSSKLRKWARGVC